MSEVPVKRGASRIPSRSRGNGDSILSLLNDLERSSALDHDRECITTEIWRTDGYRVVEVHRPLPRGTRLHKVLDHNLYSHAHDESVAINQTTAPLRRRCVSHRCESPRQSIGTREPNCEERTEPVHPSWQRNY